MTEEMGSGGLTFEPPERRDETLEPMGFAPDLDEPSPGPEDPSLQDWHRPVASAPRSQLGGPRPRGHGDAARYPLALAALQRLGSAAAPERAHLPGDARRPSPREGPKVPLRVPAPAATSPMGGGGTPAPDEAIAAFSVGPAVTWAPPHIQRAPSPPKPPSPGHPAGDPAEEPARARTEALLEDMVDVVLVGQGEGKPEIHLSFKADIFGGLYLRLERRPEGLFAHFTVPDEHARRRVHGHLDDLLARLSQSGMRICGHQLTCQTE